MTEKPYTDRIGCTAIMFRGAITGRVITCGVCAWCKAHDEGVGVDDRKPAKDDE